MLSRSGRADRYSPGFIATLKNKLPPALDNMLRSIIVWVDLAPVATGPSMVVFTRYGKDLDAYGKALTVHKALALINVNLDDVPVEKEHDFDETGSRDFSEDAIA